MAGQWYCRIAGVERGPFTAAQLRTMVLERRLAASDPIRQAGADVWIPATSVKGLFDLPPGTGASPVSKNPVEKAAAGSKSKPRLRAQPIEEPAKRPQPPSTVLHDLGLDLSAKSASPARKPPADADDRRPSGLDFLAEEEEKLRSRSSTTVPRGPRGSLKKKPVAAIRRWLLPSLLGMLVLLLAAFLVVKFGRESSTAGTEGVDKAKQESAKDRKSEKTSQGSAKTPAAGTKAPPSPGDAAAKSWIDASRSAWKSGDVAVKVKSVAIARAKTIDAAQRVADTQEDYLLVRLELASQNSARKIEFAGWGFRGPEPEMVDDLNNKYALQKAPNGGVFEGQVRSKSIYPDQALDYVLVFERPVPKAKALRLQLPAIAFGGQGTGYVEIPMSMVARGTAAAAKAPSEPATGKAPNDGWKAGEKQAAPGAKPATRGFAAAAKLAEDAQSPPSGEPKTDSTARPGEGPAETTAPAKRGPPPPPPRRSAAEGKTDSK